MKVIGVEPRDIYVGFEMSSKQIEHLLDFLDRCTIVYDSEKEDRLNDAVKYVKEELFVTLNQVSEELKQGPS